MKKIITLTTLTLIFSCSKNYELGSLAPDEVFISQEALENPTWENSIEEIVTQKCSNCHKVNRDQYVPTNTPNTFDDINDYDFFLINKDYIKDRILDSVNPMPPNFSTPLTEKEKEVILRFIENI